MTALYVTTPIYYVNDVPHLGHAYTTIIADAIARFHRSVYGSAATRFLTGTDEHGQKIEQAAAKRGLTPQQLTDQVSPRFRETWQRLNISNDDFIRTTEPRHKQVVTKLWQRMAERGDLYLASYQGWYCVGCEAFYTESQLTKVGDEWHCPTHQRAAQWVDKERSWFFRMSKYQQPLLDYIEANPGFIRPEGFRNEVVSFVKSGLKDLSVSRTSFSWGIEPPDADPEGGKHVMYVWLDALTNYFSALAANADGSVDFGSELAAKFWLTAVHLIGKDILRFHAVYWPCFLLSAGLPLPKAIVCHGWWTVRGEKISKSMPATRIDPWRLACELAQTAPLGEQIGVDALRYFLLREVPLGNDGDFTMASLFARYNAELANDLGNLINRSLTLLGKFGATTQAPPASALSEGKRAQQANVVDVVAQTISDAKHQFAEFAPARALETIWKLVREGNRYVDNSAPWALAKKVDDSVAQADLAQTLATMRGILIVIGDLIAPVLPTTTKILHGWLGIARPPAWPSGPQALDERGSTAMTTEPTPLFPRLDEVAMKRIDTAIVPPESEPPAPAAAAPPATASSKATEAPAQITYDDFAKVDLRVGIIKSATAVPKANKLLQLTVDVGEAAPRTVIAGIAAAYKPEQLIGKQVIVVANLAPAKIRGVESHGMILAAGGDTIIGLGAIDSEAPAGTKIR